MEIDLERGQAALDYAQGGRIGLGFLENGQVARMLMDSGRFMIYREIRCLFIILCIPFSLFFFPSLFLEMVLLNAYCELFMIRIL